MGFLTDWLTDWLKELLIEGIMGNLTGLFDTVNSRVGEIAVQVGTTPAAWNAGVFSLIRQLSETVILPIAGLILTFVATYELIQLIIEKNNLHECSVLPPEQLQHIFEPFYRPDLAHGQATGGNGLGLYIVQTILDKLRLKYQFVPMPNDRGMSFTIQF